MLYLPDSVLAVADAVAVSATSEWSTPDRTEAVLRRLIAVTIVSRLYALGLLTEMSHPGANMGSGS